MCADSVEMSARYDDKSDRDAGVYEVVMFSVGDVRLCVTPSRINVLDSSLAA